MVTVCYSVGVKTGRSENLDTTVGRIRTVRALLPCASPLVASPWTGRVSWQHAAASGTLVHAHVRGPYEPACR
jgi:hypothetical protein